MCRKQFTRRTNRHDVHGFTLVELLVVIGIIALLVAILLPALASARASSQSVKCMANLRMIGIGLQSYVNDNRGSLPWGDLPGGAWGGYLVNDTQSNWAVKVGTELGYTADNNDNTVFRCPSANNDGTPPAGVIANHYTCNPRLMPSYNTTPSQYTNKIDRPYKFATIGATAADLVLIMDGSQYFSTPGWPEGNAWPVAWGLNNWRYGVTGGWGNAMLNPPPSSNSWDSGYNNPIDGGPNTDVVNWSGNQANIRWRHNGDKSANFLYCDGHVSPQPYQTASINGLMMGSVCAPWP